MKNKLWNNTRKYNSNRRINVAKPSLRNIYKRLTTLKKKYLIEIDVVQTPYFRAFKKENCEKNKSKDRNVDGILINLMLQSLFDAYLKMIRVISWCLYLFMNYLMIVYY